MFIPITPYFIKSQTVIKVLFSKKGIAMLPAIVMMPIILTTMQKAIAFLVLLMVFDFITGIGASISKKRKLEKANPNVEKTRLISSGKLRKSGVKFLLYSMTIISSYFMQIIFQLKTFSLIISDTQINLCLGVIGFWCIVELYSIFFENFKDMGIDIKIIIRKITNLINFLKEKSSEVCDNQENKNKE